MVFNNDQQNFFWFSRLEVIFMIVPFPDFRVPIDEFNLVKYVNADLLVSLPGD